MKNNQQAVVIYLHIIYILFYDKNIIWYIWKKNTVPRHKLI